jgi:hypothetical protein
MLEIYRKRFEDGEEPTKLMNELEKVYKIPLMLDLEFNKNNVELMKLYLEISASRLI